jgi:soluble lytic murein transglycosylase-like protein
MPTLDFSDLPDERPGDRQPPAPSALSFDDLPDERASPVQAPAPAAPPSYGGLDTLNAFGPYGGGVPITGSQGAPGLAVNPMPAPAQPGLVPTNREPYYEGTFVRPERNGPETFFPGAYRDPTQGRFGAAGNAFVGEAAQGIISAARGVQAVTEAPAAASRYQLGVMDKIDQGNFVPGDQDPLGYGDMSPEQRRKFRADYEKALPAPPSVNPEWAEKVRTAIDQAFPVDSQLGQTSLVKSARVGGAFAPLVVAGAVGTLAGGPQGGLGAAAAMGMAQSYDATLREAAKTLPLDKAHLAAAASALVQGGLMAVPAARATALMPTLLAGPVLNVAARLAAEAGIFMSVNQVSRLADNLTARSTYDPDRPISDGLGKDIPEQLVVGALVPALMSATYNAPRAVRALTSGEPIAAPELRAGLAGLQETALTANERQPTPESTAQAEPAATPTELSFDDLVPENTPISPKAQPIPTTSANPIEVPAKYSGMIRDAAAKYGVPEQVLAWVGKQESGFNPDAVGEETRSGRAEGMFQFMRGTAEQYGIDPRDPPQAIDGAARYLRDLHDKTGSWENAVARYGTFSTGKGPEADMAVRGRFRQAIGSAMPETMAAAAGEPPRAVKAAEETLQERLVRDFPAFTASNQEAETGPPEVPNLAPAELARTDATRLTGMVDLLRDQDIRSANNQEFVRSFMAQLPEAERAPLLAPNGIDLSALGEQRIRSAVTTKAYGDDLGPMLDRLQASSNEGVRAASGALSDAAGTWAQMRDETQRGAIPANLDITQQLGESVKALAQAHELDRPVAVSPETQAVLRLFYRDEDMRQPASRQVVSGRLQAYADQARRQVFGPDLSGELAPTPEGILRSIREKPDGHVSNARLLAERDTQRAQARIEQAYDSENLTPRATIARQRMYEGGQAMMRFFGLPPETGLKFVDKLVDTATGHGADAAYTRGLITFALDTPPDQVGRKMFHEITHALMDRTLGLMTDGQRGTLLHAADYWLAQDGNRQRISTRYNVDAASSRGSQILREEAAASLAEEALERGMHARSPIKALSERMRNFVVGVGQMLRGRGYRTADDVFNALLRGDKALPGAREQMLASGAIKPGEVAGNAGQADVTPTQRTPVAQVTPGQRPEAEAAPAVPPSQPAPEVQPQLREAPPEGVDATLAKYFSPESYFSKREPKAPEAEVAPKAPGWLGRHVSPILDTVRTVSDSIKGEIAPMTLGSERAQSYASRFANGLRDVAFRFNKMTTDLGERFPLPDLQKMGRAMDAQSVFEQQLAKGEGDRAAFDQSGMGIAGLTPDQRKIVDTLDYMARDQWRRRQEREMVPPEAKGLPYYFARQIVMLDAEGKVSRAGPDEKVPSGVGRNLTTAGTMRRKYLTPEETAAAAKTKLGEGATLVEDIRSLVHALARGERAIVGRDFVDAIKKASEQAGVNLVHEGALPLFPDLPPGSKYFTLDHPALQRVRPMLERGPDGKPTGKIIKGEDGKPVFERVPIHIAEEFKGPLDAVLTKASPDWYKTFMRFKGMEMTGIMFSPYMHLQTEFGRALPLMLMDARTPWGLTRDGARLKADADYMREAIERGVSPIGHGWAKDPTSLMEEALGKRPTPLGKIRDAINTGYEAFTKTGHVLMGLPAERTLWDQVFNLQMGLYDQLRKDAIKKGHDPGTAGVIAAHLANRYAGALPPENLSRAANMLANVLLFSRSFTLGNIGVIKDMFNGAPSSVIARIAQEAGPAAANDARAFLRRKAQAAVALDMAMFYAANALFQTGIQIAHRVGDQGLDGATASVWNDYLKGLPSGQDILRNPSRAMDVFPQHRNEPGKTDRVFISGDSTGRGTYLRLQSGKIGEEFMGWFLWPATMVRNKLSPVARPVVDLIFGTDGPPIYRPNPQTIGQWVQNGGDIALHIIKSQLPFDALSGAYNLATGQGRGDRAVQAARLLAPLTGFGSISQGYPALGAMSGPEAGVKAMAQKQADYDLHTVMPSVRDAVTAGHIDKARELLAGAGVNPATQNRTIARLQSPGRSAASAARWFQRNATPEQQQQMQGVTRLQTPAQRGAGQAIQYWRQAQ